MLGGMRLQLMKSHEPRAFITSDAPCCVIDYKDTAISPFKSLSGSTANVLMPLSPEVVVLFDRSQEPHEMTQVFPNSPFVAQANAMIWGGAVATVVLPGRKISDAWLRIPRSNTGDEYVVL